MVKSKDYAATKILLFMQNYRRELRIEADIRRKEKVEKMTEFIERTKKIWSRSGTNKNLRRNENTSKYGTKGSEIRAIKECVVATTRWNNTCDMLTSAKLSVGYLVVGITRELDKEPLLHCYPIYISYRWSML